MSGLAEEELERSDASRRWRILAGLLLLAAGIAVTLYLLQGLGRSGPVQQKQVSKITILPDTPPPPPPPPPPAKEQPRENKEIKAPQPKPVEAPQAPQPLKMEGAAGEGSSPFAAGTVSSDYIGGKVGGGGGGMQFAFFSSALQRHIQQELARNRALKLGDYRVLVNVWIDAQGVMRRVELDESTGNPDTDRAIREALSQLPPLRTAVPENLPQPIRLRITNRMAG